MTDDQEENDEGWRRATAGPEDDRPEEESLPERLARRAQDRLGLAPEQWLLVESLLIAMPYAVFAGIYLAFPSLDTPLFVLSAIYTVVALWFSLGSTAARQR